MLHDHEVVPQVPADGHDAVVDAPRFDLVAAQIRGDTLTAALATRESILADPEGAGLLVIATSMAGLRPVASMSMASSVFFRASRSIGFVM